MYLKIMDANSASDAESRKTYLMLADVISVKFSRALGAGPAPEMETVAFVRLKSGELQTHHVPGDAYLMNDDGKTISSVA